MGFYENDSEQAEAYREVHTAPHGRQLSPDTIATAAAFEASMEYKGHCAVEGKLDPPSIARDELARLALEAVDRILEERQLAVDRERVEIKAREQAVSIVDDNFSSYSAARRGRRLSVC